MCHRSSRVSRLLLNPFTLIFFMGLRGEVAAQEKNPGPSNDARQPPSSLPVSAAPPQNLLPFEIKEQHKESSAQPTTSSSSLSPLTKQELTDPVLSLVNASGSSLNESKGNYPRWMRFLRISGYVQPQFVARIYNVVSSPNRDPISGELPEGIGPNAIVALPNGATTNSVAFRVRRARLKFEFSLASTARLIAEIEPVSSGSPVEKGVLPSFVRNLEAQGIVRWSPQVTTVVGGGIFPVPFGYEIQQSNADRPFVDRSWGALNMWGRVYDTGLYVTTRAFEDRLTGQVAVVNGQVLGEPQFSIQPDLSATKDFSGRINYNFGPVDIGVSGYVGRGQLVRSGGEGEFFNTYLRLASNAEFGVHVLALPKVGKTRLLSEFTLGQNMDRGLYYSFALPRVDDSEDTTSLVKTKQRAVWVRLEQDITRWVTLGARFDHYTPDTTISDSFRNTVGGVAVVHVTGDLQSMFEYNFVFDRVHAFDQDAYTGKIHTLLATLQARF
ncbi:hypothetical protein [Pajaroellobacter abortibovis]|uniref:Uncharacterized protein n=1 Tax=Pajaroellobacter abortibovis TaxID=1882918 RepID=A0A1L6MUW6_9BACT|nr:hypothetical protein [Pajaroellobacter abortibovis]APR99303.1 hypothetical protein BCY86_00400 [Pajaroellobacter abortibovis]